MILLPNEIVELITYRSASGTFPATPLGWVLHVQQGNGDPFAMFNGLRAPNRKFSNGWVAKNGDLRVYTERNVKPWAQVAGNLTYWAFETEGFPSELLTPEQVRTLAAVHRALGVADALAETPGEKGIGTHYMGGTAWGGHSCPGTVRAAQRADILAVAKGGAVTPPHKEPDPTVPPFPGYVQLGTTGVAVVKVQRQFIARGWKGATIGGVFRYLAVDGIAGPVTIAVVKSFQHEKGLTVDGVVGPVTWRAMFTYPTALGKR